MIIVIIISWQAHRLVMILSIERILYHTTSKTIFTLIFEKALTMTKIYGFFHLLALGKCIIRILAGQPCPKQLIVDKNAQADLQGSLA